MIPVAIFRPIAEAWIGQLDSREEACQVLAAAIGLTADAWRKRLSETTYEGRTGATLPLGWFAMAELDDQDVDEFLTAAGLAHLWYEPPLDGYHEGKVVGLRCEDCDKAIVADADDYFPLDLMRPDPSASRWVWDSTKRKLVFRPRNARPGGRRFRKVDLCRRCSADALRKRAQPGVRIMPDGKRKVMYTTIRENGKKRFLRPTERIAPRRGGRPRLLDEPKLRALHAAYETGLSIRDLTLQLIAAGHPGTQQGLYQSMLYGWRNLGLKIRSRPESIRIAHHRRGRIPREKQVRCSGKRSRGKPCRQWRRVGFETCWFHADQEPAAELVAA